MNLEIPAEFAGVLVPSVACSSVGAAADFERIRADTAGEGTAADFERIRADTAEEGTTAGEGTAAAVGIVAMLRNAVKVGSTATAAKVGIAAIVVGTVVAIIDLQAAAAAVREDMRVGHVARS